MDVVATSAAEGLDDRSHRVGDRSLAAAVSLPWDVEPVLAAADRHTVRFGPMAVRRQVSVRRPAVDAGAFAAGLGDLP